MNEKKNFLDGIIGLGMGGSRIAKAFSEERKISYKNINFSSSDMHYSEINNTLILNGDGTGRSLIKGKELTNIHKEKIIDYVNTFSHNKKSIGICVGLGGGSGASLMELVIRTLLESRKNLILFASIPNKSEGLPSANNYLLSLSTLIGSYLQSIKSRISIIILENDLLENYSSNNGNYYSELNKHLVENTHSIYDLINKNNSSMERAFVIDKEEFNRVIFSGGLIDFKNYKFKSEDILEELNNLSNKNFTSSFNKKLFSTSSAKGSLLEVTFPMYFFHRKNINTLIDGISNKVSKFTRINNMLKGISYSASIKRPEIDIIIYGLDFSGTIQRKIMSTEKAIDKVSKLDLKAFKNKRF